MLAVAALVVPPTNFTLLRACIPASEVETVRVEGAPGCELRVA